MNTAPIILPDGYVIAKVTHSMGGATYPLGVTRYGSRYYLRDLGPSEERSRCSFTIRADDLRRVLDQADAEPGTFGDMAWLTIGVVEGFRDGKALKDEYCDCEADDDDDEDDPTCDTSDEPRTAKRLIQASLEGWL